MNNAAKRWLEKGRIDVLLAYREVEGHPVPHVFQAERLEELEQLVVSPERYPLEKLAADLAARHPDLKIGILGRDCTQRALDVMQVYNAMPAQVEVLTVSCCPANLATRAHCSYQEDYGAKVAGKTAGIPLGQDPAALAELPEEERLSRWLYEFSKCIKCYGCRNICPVCFCKECSLEDGELVKGGPLPPETPIFHLVRAVHMAGRCIDCGLCEEACPMDIPLRTLYREVNRIVEDLFGSQKDGEAAISPLEVLGEKVFLEPKPLDAVQ